MSSLKLPLKIVQCGTIIDIFDGDQRHIINAHAFGDAPSVLLHRAEIIVAALEADAELGVPICECCTKKGTEPYWHQECDCMNQGDLADAAGWCAVANLLERKPNTEKETQDG